MRKAPMIVVERPRGDRVARLLDDYGKADLEDLIAATQKISRRLGGLRARQVVEYIQKQDLHAAVEMILDYYDRTYQAALTQRSGQVRSINAEGLTDAQWSDRLLELSRI